MIRNQSFAIRTYVGTLARHQRNIIAHNSNLTTEEKNMINKYIHIFSTENKKKGSSSMTPYEKIMLANNTSTSTDLMDVDDNNNEVVALAKSVANYGAEEGEEEEDDEDEEELDEEEDEAAYRADKLVMNLK